MLGQLESDERIVIADMEAGAGTLTRMPSGALDVAVLMVEPSAKSIDAARRAALIIAERHIGMVLLAANRVRSDDDLQLIRASIPGVETLAVPDDPSIAQADREAKSPLDLAPDTAGVSAMRAVAQRLERWARQSSPTGSLTVL